ncbi:hypothetical protein MN608_10704 [Microdochium nivale]|nr:hypothetical protein MN608_10704 [Microdochium nivale]
MQLQLPTLVLATFLSTAAAVDIRFYTGPNCQGSFSSWNGVPVESCFATSSLAGAGAVGFADLSAAADDVRLVAYSGPGGCGDTIAFEVPVAGNDFVCAPAGPYDAAGVFSAK